MSRLIGAVAIASLLIAGCGGGGGGTKPPIQPNAATPTFSPGSGSFNSAQNVAISDSTAGASIYYTTNGSAPTTSSTLYSSPIAVSSNMTIEAMAVASGYNPSAVGSATYTVKLPAASTPQFSPAPGSYMTAQSVVLSCVTAGASIYFTTDGSTPTATSTLYSAPITVSSTTVINAIAIAEGYSNSSVVTGTYTFPLAEGSIGVVLSTQDRTQLMATQTSLGFTNSTADASTNTIVIDPAQQYQTMEGFGASFTDSAAYLLGEVVPPDQLQGAMSDLFTRNGNGIGLSFMRIPMGASDIARSVYSFDDGTTDLNLANFSIAHDQAYVLPVIQQAKTLNPQMKLMANPWSPPGWMKDSGTMMGGNLLMTSANETAFAKYFVKYLQAYQSAGVPIDYISLQNEPMYNTASYPSMYMTDSQQLALLQGYVLPALSAANLQTKVFVWDHNWDTPSYPEFVLSNLTSQQLTQVAGTAWHGYGGTPGAQQTIQNEFANLGTWETEHSGGTWVNDQFSSDFLEITQVLRNAAKSYVKWSLALDESLGPNLTQNAGLGGCNTCTPIVTVNSQTGAVTKDVEYYTLGQYSKFVLPGAVRIYSSDTPAIASVAFLNPDGSTALIAYNSSGSSQVVHVQWGTETFSYTLSAFSAATFSWIGTVNGATPPIAATAQIQASSYSDETGVQTESTADATGQYDLGYISVGARVLYRNVDFGNGVSSVSVRAASGGNGGTANFYLDSPQGTPIATVNLPVTGGWQIWTNVSAGVSGASGVHDLYVVYAGGGSSGIANVNWFQFQ
ncbi:MAG TPA: chitobiase/beta-hexosaminidase C-terminal domain-containing protein [Terracidiphilus sp.]|nr:chitobiase/beta-hexosaminidase C-terminal domain-containing protein [Terracidiphilus sp.]